MVWKKGLLGLVLVIFLLLNIRALHAHSFLGVIWVITANPGTQLVLVDLVIALVLVSIWLVMDAQKKGNAIVPFLLLTFVFGSVGPLAYLILRDFSPKVQRVESILLLVLLGGYSAVFYPVPDLHTQRPASETSLEMEARGRTLLAEMARAHGVEAWQGKQTLTMHATDHWAKPGWWPEKSQELKMSMVTGSFTSQVLLTGGKGQGEIWGIQAWQPYRQMNEASPLRELMADEPVLSFYLPSLHYFAELPFRLIHASYVRYQGKTLHRGRHYEQVLVSWGETQPHPDFDQYLLWIDAESKTLSMVRYTVREAARFATPPLGKLMRSLALGTIYFEDYQEVDGVKLPYLQTVTLFEPALTHYPLHAHFFHRLEVDHFAFDKVSPQAVMPLSQGGMPSDSKAGRPDVI